MNAITPYFTRRFVSPFAAFALSLSAGSLAAGPGQPANGALSPVANADFAWGVLQAALRPVPVFQVGPAQRPSPELFAAYRLTVRTQALQAANLAQDFYTRYPSHLHASDARAAERQRLALAADYGDASACDRLDALDADTLKRKDLSDDQRFSLLCASAHRRVFALTLVNDNAARVAAEKQLRDLLKAYPQKVEVQYLFLNLANSSPPEKGKSLAQELLTFAGQDDIRRGAQGIAAGKKEVLPKKP